MNGERLLINVERALRERRIYLRNVITVPSKLRLRYTNETARFSGRFIFASVREW